MFLGVVHTFIILHEVFFFSVFLVMNELETGYLKNIEGLVEYSSVIRYDPIKM